MIDRLFMSVFQIFVRPIVAERITVRQEGRPRCRGRSLVLVPTLVRLFRPSRILAFTDEGGRRILPSDLAPLIYPSVTNFEVLFPIQKM